MAIHFEMLWNHWATESYKRKRDYPNRRNIHVHQIPHLRDRFYHLEEFDDEDFRLRSRLIKVTRSLTSKKFWIKTFQQYTRRGLPLTPLLQVPYCFEILYNSGELLSRSLATKYFSSVSVFSMYTEPFTRFQGPSGTRKEHSLSFPGNLAYRKIPKISPSKFKLPKLLT